MKIDRHISELLYEHDCVIVPSFGGFLASYQSAQFQPIRHIFNPPSKKIAFNVHLKHNDGLLANHVAQVEKLTYVEALKNIERFRMEMVWLLDSGNRITIEDVGTLFYDKNKNLQFEPEGTVNYLEEAFGLTAVQSPPVKREEQRKNIERRIREATAIRSSVKPQRVKMHGKLKPSWKIFNTVTLTGALLWFGFNIYFVAPHHENISSLNPFSYSSTEKTEPLASAPKSTLPKAVPSTTPTLKKADSVNIRLPEKQPAENNPVAIAAPPAHIEEVVPANAFEESEKNFFVIAGAFREPGNAEKLVNSLKQEGFTDAHIINPESSFKKVCYRSFTTRKEALFALEQIHTSKKEGWILKK